MESAYVLWANDNREDFVSEMGTTNAAVVDREMTRRWDALSPEEKKEYIDQVEPTPTPSTPKNQKPKRAPKTKEQIDVSKNAPKKPSGPWIYFTMEQRSVILNEMPSLTNKDVLGELGLKWKEYTDDAKKPYVEKALKDKERYEEEMKYYNDNVQMPSKS
ncbi:hypothetical protein GEMRC1_007065 [Eukaryota sp. GEM-RC1]